MLCRSCFKGCDHVMYIQNLAHTRPSINRSCSCQKSFSGAHLPFFDPQIIAPSHIAQHYIKAIQIYKDGKSTAERNSPIFKVSAHLILIKNPDKQLQGWAERKQGRQNPASPWCCCPQAVSCFTSHRNLPMGPVSPCHGPSSTGTRSVHC